MVLLYIFGISFVFVFGIIFVKVYEYTHRRKIFISRFFAQFDSHTEQFIEKVFGKYDTLKLKLSALVQEEIPRQTRYFFLLLKKVARERYASLILDVRGNRKLRQDPNVSSFLRDISKHKEEHKGGRIDDTMVQ